MNKPSPASEVQQPALLVERSGPILTLTLHNPPRHNALSDATLAALQSALWSLQDARVIVLRGEGKHFCSGLDLSEHRERTPLSVLEVSRAWHGIIQRLRTCGLPVIAELQGAVIGGGFELAASAHIRIAEPSTFFQLPEGKRGIYIGGGGSVTIARAIGVNRMTEIMLTGRKIDRDEAHSIGLVHVAVEEGQARDRAMELARQVADNAPLVNYMITQTLPRMADLSAADGLFMESLGAALCHTSEDASSGMTDFLSRNK